MNLHLFEVVLLIHANETLHKGDWVKFERGEKSPSKHRDCLILLCLLVLALLVEPILLSKYLYVEVSTEPVGNNRPLL